MLEFHQMTSAQLREYRGPVFTARCVFRNRRTGNLVPVDYQSPTREGLRKLFLSGVGHFGKVVSVATFAEGGAE